MYVTVFTKIDHKEENQTLHSHFYQQEAIKMQCPLPGYQILLASYKIQVHAYVYGNRAATRKYSRELWVGLVVVLQEV